MDTKVSRNTEPLTTPDPRHYALGDVKSNRQGIWDFYKQQVSMVWPAEEVSMAEDVVQWETRLSEEARFFIKRILAFFATADGIVSENLILNFMAEIEWAEVRAFYGWQNAMEIIHSESYTRMIQALIPDRAEREVMFNAIEDIATIRNMAQWTAKYMNKDTASLAMRLVAFACVEGVFFSAPFCAIFWLRSQHLMPGLTQYNILISRDEGLHTDFACYLYRTFVKHKLSEVQLHAIVREAVETQIEFVTESLPVALLGMNSSTMTAYVKFVANQLVRMMNPEKGPRLYSDPYPDITTNPYPFMDRQMFPPRTNIHELHATEYARGCVGKSDKENSFRLDAEF